MENERIQKSLEQSFLGKYLKDDGITDISYNGTDLWVQHNQKGRLKPNEQPSKEQIDQLIKQITDIKNVEFTHTSPKLNVDMGYLRVNAMHPAISPDGLTFSIRVSKPRLAVEDISSWVKNNRTEVGDLLKVLVQSGKNIVISGRTGTGKTELQKLLVGYIPDNEKITLIEDTRDSHIKRIYPKKDINSWQTIKEIFSMSNAVEEGLRNNPDWIIVAETRGVEAADMLDAAKTDHSIITTLHATGAINIPSRFIPMIKRSPAYQTISEHLIGKELVDLMRFGVHLKSSFIDGRIVRSLKEIVEFVDFDEKGVIGNYLYREEEIYDELNEVYHTKQSFGTLSDKTINELKDRRLYHLIPDVFIDKERGKMNDKESVKRN